MTGAALAEKTPLERTIQSWGGLFGAAGTGGAAAFLQGRRFSRQTSESNASAALDEEDCWEASLRQQNAANDELCSENGRLRAEIERLRAEEEAATASASGGAAASAADASAEPAEAGAAGPSAPEDEAEEEVLEAVAATVWEVLAQWPSTPVTAEPTPGSEDATDGEEPPAEDGVGAADDGAKEQAAEADEEEVVEAAGDGEASEGFKANEDEVLPEEASVDPAGSGVSSPNGEWQGGVVAAVEAAVRAGLDEAGNSSTPEPALSPAEETAVLVAEKIALRELVERQQERIEALETQLHEADPMMPLGAGALGGALAAGGGALAAGGGALGSNIARGFHDASGAFTAGLSAVLAPKVFARIAEVGVEYEVVGRKGAIVRSEESLRSDQIAELPPGTRVRVMSVSDKYPRRVEIVAVQASASSAAAPAVGAAKKEDAGAESGSPAAGGADADGTAPTGDAHEEPSTPSAPIVGWISASTKDGTMLIHPAPPDAAAATAGGTAGDAGPSAEPESKEEGNEEVAQVTLSSVEWDCLHRDREASLRRVEALTARLNETGCELLQSFEMRSVLGELQLGVDRALERSERMRETAALAWEELEQRRAQRRWETHQRQSGGRGQRQRGERPHLEGDGVCERSPGEEAASAPSNGSTAHGGASTAAASTSSPVGQGSSRKGLGASGEQSPVERMEAVDWERLLSERETTAAALSAALRRAACLEREAAELQSEREAAEGRCRSELQLLREKLRRLAKPSLSGPGPPQASGSADLVAGGDASSAIALCAARGQSGDGLFRRCVEDLQHTVSGLKLELRRASASEAALRCSVEARSSALRTLLHRGATAGLSSLQCGPLKLPASAEAERRALVLAVEEQLRFNLLLRSSRERQGSDSAGSSGAASTSPSRSSARRDRSSSGPQYTMLSSVDSDSA